MFNRYFWLKKKDQPLNCTFTETENLEYLFTSSIRATKKLKHNVHLYDQNNLLKIKHDIYNSYINDKNYIPYNRESSLTIINFYNMMKKKTVS